MNGVPERGVKLIQEYNNILTKYETEKQFVCVSRETLKNQCLTLCFKFHINYCYKQKRVSLAEVLHFLKKPNISCYSLIIH